MGLVVAILTPVLALLFALLLAHQSIHHRWTNRSCWFRLQTHRWRWTGEPEHIEYGEVATYYVLPLRCQKCGREWALPEWLLTPEQRREV